MAMLKPPTMPKVSALPSAPVRATAAEAAQPERMRLLSAQGFSSTIGTTSLGSTGAGAMTTRKLLGYG